MLIKHSRYWKADRFDEFLQIDEDFKARGDLLVIAQQYLPIIKEKLVELKKQILHSINKGTGGEKEEL